MITEDHFAELDALLKKCLEHDNLLSDWENDFISQFVDKLEEYGESLRISDKQQQIFSRIEEKLKKLGVEV